MKAMDTVLLTIHLILALILISAVLIQRSEGGGLGSSGDSGGGVMSGRSAATAMTKLTWIIATAFLITSISLTVLAAKRSTKSSVLDGNITTEKGETLSIPLPDLKTLEAVGSSNTPTSPPSEE
jgi:preprotein translocase subunit SecG